MIISEINPAGSDASLNQFASRQRLLFYSASWLSCYPPGVLTQCAIRNNNQEIIGCFMFFTFRKAALRFVITPPWMPDIALSFINPAESVVGRSTFVKDIMRVVSDYFASLKVAYVSINIPYHISDTQPFIWKKFSPRVRHTYIVDLDQSEEDIKKNLSSEKRKSLNKAAKDGLRITQQGDAKVVYSLVMRSLARSNKDKNTGIAEKLISSLFNTPDAICFIAYDGNRPVAATFCVIDNDRALYLFGGYDEAAANHGAGVACLWQCMLEAKNRSLRLFDFEGSMDPDIERYFREFGGKLVAYQCVEKINPGLKILLRLKGHRPL